MKSSKDITRVTDEDLELLKQYGAWTTDAVERLRHAKCVDNVIAELLALRKVADAAGEWAEQPCEPGPPPRLTDEEQKLIDALREASR